MVGGNQRAYPSFGAVSFDCCYKKEAKALLWKKIEKAITMCIAALLVVVATISSTLAYESLSAWDWSQQTKETVKVGLVQEQRSYDAEGNLTGLKPWAEYPQLVPLVQ